MSRKGRRWLVLALSVLVVFCIWKINTSLPDFPEIYFLDEAAIYALNAVPTPEPTANPHREPIEISGADYAMCRKVASGVSFSQRILEAHLPDRIRLKRSIKYKG